MIETYSYSCHLLFHVLHRVFAASVPRLLTALYDGMCLIGFRCLFWFARPVEGIASATESSDIQNLSFVSGSAIKMYTVDGVPSTILRQHNQFEDGP